MSRSSSRPTRLVAAGLAVGTLLALAGCSGDGDVAPGGSTGSPASSAPASTDAVGTLIDTGLSQIRDGDRAGARGTFSAVLALDADNVYAHYNLGYLSQLDDDAETARQQYEQALETDPAFAPALYNLALLTEPSDLDAAIALYRRGIEAAPDDAATYMRLGFALQHQGAVEEGQRMLDRGIELDPSMADVAPPSYAG